eukprot:TRINITY_DN8907_c1_g3_i1.p1 TRINITY_DN8907_c1_g3~~TRINITY_DN8907_c1_g3_i1.p1  ORF type:complete len:904 (+),score=235.31 TRINITY_DN8907_c1_g3_i1:138-2849(+)
MVRNLRVAAGVSAGATPLLSPRSTPQTPHGHLRLPDRPSPSVVVSLETVQSERLRADIAESLLNGRTESWQAQLEDMHQAFMVQQARADSAESDLARLQQEVAELRAVRQVHEEVAAEATRKAMACETVKRKLQEELELLLPGARSAEEGTTPEQCGEASPSAPASSRRKAAPGEQQESGGHLSMKMMRNHLVSKSTVSDDSRRSTLGDEESVTPTTPRMLPERALLNMVQASADEVLHAQIDLGLEKQNTSRLQSRLRQAEEECQQLSANVAELQALRISERELRSAKEASLQEAERLRADLAASRKLANELELALQSTAAERDRFAQSVADNTRCIAELRESEAALRAKAEASEHDSRSLRMELARLRSSQQSEQKELQSLRTQIQTARAENEALATEKRRQEAEFRVYQQYHGTGDQVQMKALAQLEFQNDALTRQMESTKCELGAQQNSTEQMRATIAALEEQVRVMEIQRRETHNQLQELKGNIRVFCRVRPLLDCTDVALHLADHTKLQLTHSDGDYAFTFDKVFGYDAVQAEIFDEVDGLVQSALDGYKVSIFAYGQTGSGKTYTMYGTDEPGAWGLVPRSLSKILQTSQTMRSQGWSWSLQVSIMEVYNENLRDLLRGGGDNAAGPGPAHTIQHHESWGTIVTNMTCVEVGSMEQIYSLMSRAAKQRSVGATGMNAVSSRSHCIFALYLKGTNVELGVELCGALHLVDLSGSERLDKSLASGERLKETQSINKSLSSLADVFVAKAEGRPHIPFRNSKLTYLMEPCLSGQGKTLMVVNVRPEQSNSHETLCSLRFAKQVNQCNTGGKPRRCHRLTAAATPGHDRGGAQARSPGAAAPTVASAAASNASSGAPLYSPKTPRTGRRATSHDGRSQGSPGYLDGPRSGRRMSATSHAG